MAGKPPPVGTSIPYPVVKFFAPGESATGLLTKLDPDEPERAFGLCDLGHEMPELGYVSISELKA